MVAGCGNKCVKYFFWLINFLFFILGAVILALAIWIRVDSSMLGKISTTTHIDFSRLPMDSVNYIMYGVMAVAGLLLILGFFGCCGSACESLCVIGLYFLLVIALFVVKIVAIVLYFVQKDKIKEYMQQIIRNEIVSRTGVSQAHLDIMNTLQSGLQCCGSYGCADYTSQALGIPPSCGNCAYNPPGCGYKLWEVIEGNLLIVIVIVFAILVVELFAVILSCIMCGAVKDKRNQSY